MPILMAQILLVTALLGASAQAAALQTLVALISLELALPAVSAHIVVRVPPETSAYTAVMAFPTVSACPTAVETLAVVSPQPVVVKVA